MLFKFQQGGIAIPPLVSYTPVMVTLGSVAEDAPSSKKAGGDESSNGLSDKDIVKLLDHLDGLPNDILKITKALLNFYIDQQLSPFPNTANIASQYAQLRQLIIVANFNRKMFDEAKEAAEKSGGINEIAVNSRGQVYCVNNEGDFQLFRPEEILKGYFPVTNQELLRLRAYDPSLADNNRVLEVVGSGIGMKDITDYINNVISGLGKNEDEEEGFLRTSSKEVLTGLQAYREALNKAESQGDYDASIDNLYKGKYMNASQAKLAELAMIYLYRSLPENAKAVLKMKTPTRDDKGAIDLVSQLLQSRMTNVTKFSLSVDTPTVKTNSDGTKTQTGTFDALKLDPVALLEAGYGLKQNITIQTAGGGMNGLEIPTVRMPIVSKEGKSMGVGTLMDVAESGFAGYLDLENVSMGGVRVDPTGFQNIAVNGTALYTAYLPIDLAEFLRTGNIKPDIDSLRRLKEAQKEITSKGITDKDKINEIYQQHSLPIMFDGNGDVVAAYKKFGIINGTAISQAFAEDAEMADYLSETTDENTIRNVLGILLRGRGDKDRIDFDTKDFWESLGIGSYDHVYRGTIFIPVNDDYFMYSAPMGLSLTRGQAEEIEARQQAKARENYAVNTYVDPGNEL